MIDIIDDNYLDLRSPKILNPDKNGVRVRYDFPLGAGAGA